MKDHVNIVSIAAEALTSAFGTIVYGIVPNADADINEVISYDSAAYVTELLTAGKIALDDTLYVLYCISEMMAGRFHALPLSEKIVTKIVSIFNCDDIGKQLGSIVIEQAIDGRTYITSIRYLLHIIDEIQSQVDMNNMNNVRKYNQYTDCKAYLEEVIKDYNQH